VPPRIDEREPRAAQRFPDQAFDHRKRINPAS